MAKPKLQVTEYALTMRELQFAFNQVEKYNPGDASWRKKNGEFAVFRKPPKKRPGCCRQ